MSGWIAGGTAVVGAAASLMSANKNAKAGANALNQQQQAQQADLAFRQQQYQRYMGLYGPTEEKLAGEAQSSQPLDYAQNAAVIKQNYSDALRNINTSSGLRGIAGSGLDLGAMRGAAFGQASGLTGAYAQGLIDRRNLGLTLTGRNQIQTSANSVMGGYQNSAGLYGQQAGMYNQAAAQGWQNAGQGLGNLGYSLQQMNKHVPHAQQPGAFAAQNAYSNWMAQNQGNVPYAPVEAPPPAGGTFNGQAIL